MDMRTARFATVALALVFLTAWQLPAQEKPKLESKPEPKTLKLQLTVVEQEGEKKLSNLPYTIFVESDSAGHGFPATKLRVGSRIPVSTGLEGEKISFQYIDIGTNIDARAYSAEDGKYELIIAIERSWVDGEVPAPTGSNSLGWRQPSFHQFKTEMSLKLRDGQTVQSTQAADPLNGRVLTLTATINVVK
jgi:hypothetical protein